MWSKANRIGGKQSRDRVPIASADRVLIEVDHRANRFEVL
jgi:hypothetical protein